jgi:hypothetical protein
MTALRSITLGTLLVSVLGACAGGSSEPSYEIPALEPAAYFFRCDAHPVMTGVVTVEG